MHGDGLYSRMRSLLLNGYLEPSRLMRHVSCMTLDSGDIIQINLAYSSKGVSKWQSAFDSMTQ